MGQEVISKDIADTVADPLPWGEFSGATILVTGASGFLPAYMVETLLHLNKCGLPAPARVIALVRDGKRATERFHRYLDRPDLEFLVQDVCDPITLPRRVDYVIHAASQASPRFFKSDPVGTLSANIIGTHNLLKAIQNRDVRGFLFFSSAEVYGTPSQPQVDIKEVDFGYLDPTEVRACYAESKRMGETMCVAWSHQLGVPTRIVRPFHTYGPGMRLDDGRVFADFVRDIVSHRSIVLNSDGSARRCFCYLGDANRAYFTVLLKGVDGGAYNVANPAEEYSIAELADRLAEMYAAEGMTVERRYNAGAGHASNQAAVARPDIAKMTALGWTPRVSVEEGFRRTVDSYRDLARVD